MNNHKYHDLLGERKSQILILTDKSGKYFGTATREECHKGEGLTHLAFMAFVLDESGKIILAKRSSKKSLWPLFWDASVVSHVLPNETPKEAANRRGKEELGIGDKFSDIGSFYYRIEYNRGAENEYCHVLFGKSSEQITINSMEIDDVKKLTLDELVSETREHPDIYTPWLKIACKQIPLEQFL